MAGFAPRGAIARTVAIAATAVLAVGVAALSIYAVRHANPDLAPEQAAPVPTFTLGVQTETPTPTPTAAAAAPRETERFFSAGATAWWRATAGVCGGGAPLVERSTNGGQSWTNVTATYLGLAQVQSLDAFSPVDGELVGSLAPNCATQALRTFTQGRFWESYPDILAVSRYLDAADQTVVHMGAQTVDAPCDEPRSLRATGGTVAMVCEGYALQWEGEAWVRLATTDAVALATTSNAVIVAHAEDGCDGVALTRFVNNAPAELGCAAGVDPASPLAIAVVTGKLLLWSGDAIVPFAVS